VRETDTKGESDSVTLLLDARPGAYLSLVLAVVLGSFFYSIRKDGLFSCQASGYGADRYAAYCQATKYGDYDHGAFWFDLEPSASEAATNAEVLFLGNSRMQFGFSAGATDEWFSSLSAHYYLLGFSHNGNYTFEAPLLRKLGARAKAYVINVDLFFEDVESRPVRTVMRDRSARARYEQKRMWQHIHRPICTTLSTLCRNEMAFFRSRETGAWRATGGDFEGSRVSYDESIDDQVLEAYTAAGSVFLQGLPASRDCVMLTIVPNVGTALGTAKAVADALGLSLLAPELDGLNTFDGSHLDRQSAERWSTAFMQAAAPRIRRCLIASPDRVSLSRSH
jgi:hypothetical protein